MSNSASDASPLEANPSKGRDSRFYATAWSWQFYAGLYVVPFLLMLAITGSVMVFFTGFHSRLGLLVHVAPQAQTQAQGSTPETGSRVLSHLKQLHLMAYRRCGKGALNVDLLRDAQFSEGMTSSGVRLQPNAMQAV